MKVLTILLIFSVAFVHGNPLIRQQSAVDNERINGVVTGVNALVSQLIESVKYSLSNLKAQTESWIQNEGREVVQSMENGVIAFNQYVQQVQAQLEALINDQLKPCLEGIPEEIRAVHEETRSRIQTCQENGWSQLSLIEEDIENYRNINQEAAEGVVEFIQTCGNLTDVGDKIKCAVDAARNITNTIRVIRENIVNTSTIVSAKIRSAVTETHECISVEQQNGHQKIQAIFEEARQCLEESTDASETTEASQAEIVQDDSDNIK